MKITAAANEQLGFQHPVHAEWKHISFCQFAGPLAQENGELVGPNAVCVRPGKIDRSPTGTGCSARMAVLQAQGRMQVGDRYRARSIIGSEFECGIESLTSLGRTAAIVPTVSGRAWITGTINSCSTRTTRGPRLSDCRHLASHIISPIHSNRQRTDSAGADARMKTRFVNNPP